MWVYTKFLVALAGAAVNALNAAVTDGEITSNEWVSVLLGVLAAAGVYWFPNRDETAA